MFVAHDPLPKSRFERPGVKTMDNGYKAKEEWLGRVTKELGNRESKNNKNIDKEVTVCAQL